jgi:hypothetical protein
MTNPQADRLLRSGATRQQPQIYYLVCVAEVHKYSKIQTWVSIYCWLFDIPGFENHSYPHSMDHFWVVGWSSIWHTPRYLLIWYSRFATGSFPKENMVPNYDATDFKENCFNAGGFVHEP